MHESTIQLESIMDFLRKSNQLQILTENSQRPKTSHHYNHTNRNSTKLSCSFALSLSLSLIKIGIARL